MLRHRDAYGFPMRTTKAFGKVRLDVYSVYLITNFLPADCDDGEIRICGMCLAFFLLSRLTCRSFGIAFSSHVLAFLA